jgi:hypothetical protein
MEKGAVLRQRLEAVSGCQFLAAALIEVCSPRSEKTSCPIGGPSRSSHLS